MIAHKFEISDMLEDNVSGFAGVVMAITKYSTGCLHYGLQSNKLKDEKPIDWEWFDESRLTRTKKNAVKFQYTEKPTSGPEPNAPSM